MPRYVINYEKRFEGEYDNKKLAIEDFLDHMDDRIEEVELDIGVFNERSKKWEWEFGG